MLVAIWNVIQEILKLNEILLKLLLIFWGLKKISPDNGLPLCNDVYAANSIIPELITGVIHVELPFNGLYAKHLCTV